jgi:hypothetical protein
LWNKNKLFSLIRKAASNIPGIGEHQTAELRELLKNKNGSKRV